MAAHYRFVEPIIRALPPVDDVTLLLPDPEKLLPSQIGANLTVAKIIEQVENRTKRLRTARDCAMHFKWLLSGIQNAKSLENFYQHMPQPHSDRIRWLSQKGLTRPLAPFYLSVLRMWERSSQPDQHVVAHLQALKPDVLLASPGVYPILGYAAEVDYVKAARSLHIPTAVLVSSWDNLTTKSTFHVNPDKVLVWNRVQVSEAVRFHGIAEDAVQAVGAPVFDQMFDLSLRDDRAEFCRSVGLDPGQPYVLWAASSRAIKADERKVVKGVLEEMRKRPELQGWQMLVRPHPKFPNRFKKFSDPDAVLWESPGFPDHAEAARGLYNCLAHSRAVAGLSTSVFLEAAALDLPCAMLKASTRAPETIHADFPHYGNLIEEGYPSVTADEEDFSLWLTKIAKGEDPTEEKRRKFVVSFMRPQGVEKPSAPLAAAILREMKTSK